MYKDCLIIDVMISAQDMAMPRRKNSRTEISVLHGAACLSSKQFDSKL